MLICKACGAGTEGVVCADCSAENPPEAKYCAYCGCRLAAAVSCGACGDPDDLDNRVLCSDEMCIGIINEQGICTECGKPLKAHS